MSDINWGEILSHCYFKCFSNPFLSLFSFCYSHQSNRWESHLLGYTFCSCPTVLGHSLFFQSLFSLLFNVEGSIDISPNSEILFLSCVWSTNKPIKGILHFSHAFLISSVSFQFLEFLSTCIAHLVLHAVYVTC